MDIALKTAAVRVAKIMKSMNQKFKQQRTKYFPRMQMLLFKRLTKTGMDVSAKSQGVKKIIASAINMDCRAQTSAVAKDAPIAYDIN